MLNFSKRIQCPKISLRPWAFTTRHILQVREYSAEVIYPRVRLGQVCESRKVTLVRSSEDWFSFPDFFCPVLGGCYFSLNRTEACRLRLLLRFIWSASECTVFCVAGGRKEMKPFTPVLVSDQYFANPCKSREREQNFHERTVFVCARRKYMSPSRWLKKSAIEINSGGAKRASRGSCQPEVRRIDWRWSTSGSLKSRRVVILNPFQTDRQKPDLPVREGLSRIFLE